MKKNDLIELIIEDYAFEGKGVAKINFPGDDGTKKKYVIFVNNAYPGDKVLCKIYKIKKSYAEAAVEKILISSSFRTVAKCRYFGVCGGCKQQDMEYKYQLEMKRKQVKDIFSRIGGFLNLEIEEILPSSKIYFYRNKMEFSFADKRWLTPLEIVNHDKITDKNFALGLHIPGTFDKVLDITECHLQSEISNQILNETRKFFKSNDTSIYSTKTHTGYLRNLIIRQSASTSDLMINLVTSENNERLFTKYFQNLSRKYPEITTIVNNINTKMGQTSIGDYEKIYWGNGYIFDKIGNYSFRISANSFFQTNTLQAEHLYKTALEFADFSGNEIVYDLYSGAGTIAIFISGAVLSVWGFENILQANKDAEYNSILNKVKNTKYVMADLNKSFLNHVREHNIPLPDVIIADPPRSGMNPRTLSDIIKLNPRKIVYISCNPATQVRDIKILYDAGFNISRIKPIDMFPHTFHIENIVLLTK